MECECKKKIHIQLNLSGAEVQQLMLGSPIKLECFVPSLNYHEETTYILLDLECSERVIR